MDTIVIYTDGGCKNNHCRENNIGGWGVYIEYMGSYRVLMGGTVNTTNKLMELTAAIRALEAIEDKSIPVIVYSDSMYVVSGISYKIHAWIKNNWRTRLGKPVKNVQLWVLLWEQVRLFRHVEFRHCYGHRDIEGNILADKLATRAILEIEYSLGG